MQDIKDIIEPIQQQRALLFLGQKALASDALCAVCGELARLPFRKVISWGGEDGLVAAWRRVDRLVTVVSPIAAAPQINEDHVTWLTLPKDGEAEPPWMAQLVRNWFATHVVCFVGCDLEAWAFKTRYLGVADDVGPHRPAYWAIASHPLDEGEQHDWEQKGIRFVATSPRDWARELLTAWEKISEETRATTDAPADQPPYPFLDSYTEADAGRFFGRADEIRNLGELVLAERLVVCFGPSGVGKTSLLQAGLMPRLRRQGCLPLYCRPERDPVATIRQAALAEAEDAQGKALSDRLDDLSRGTQRTVVVILDQFEEVFTLLGTETLAPLLTELAACLRLPGAPVHVVFSLREDFLVYLHDLQTHLPGVFAHRYRLRPLCAAEAREAIEAPARRVGLGYEPALAAQIVRDLRREDGTIEPSDLQIVCSALYEDLKDAGGNTFTLTRYRALGSAAQLLAGHLESVVAHEPNPAQVKAVLKAMVTAQGTKASLPAAEIARLADIEEETATANLRRLDRPHRLVRPLEQEGETRYELIHEVLGPRILAWIEEPAEREAKAIHDLLRIEVHNWRHFDALPGPDKVRAVDAQRENPYLRLGRDEVEILVRSAVRHGVSEDYWLERAEAVGVIAGDFLLPALTSPQDQVRERAARLLDHRRALAELARLLREAVPELRARAVATLGDLDAPRARRLLRRARHDPDPTVRAAAWNALEARAPRPTARLRRQDEVRPMLVAGSLVYWLTLFITGAIAMPDSTMLQALVSPKLPAPVSGALLYGVLWLLTLGLAGWLAPRLPAPLLAWPGLALTAGAFIARWGWVKGGGLFVLMWLLGGDLRRKPHLPLAAFLCYLPLLALPLTAGSAVGITGAALMTLALLALLVPRWGRYGADRPAALALLCASVGGALGAPLIGEGAAAALLMGGTIAWGRWQARRPSAYSGSQKLGGLVGDLGRSIWDDLIGQISPQLKPFLGGTAGAWLGALLLRAAHTLPGSGPPPWALGDALWLGVGVGLGLWWGQGRLLRALLWPVAGGALGGALARGAAGAVVGAALGLGLGLGEWWAARIEGRGENGQSTEERNE
jgi:hypothetical protein